MESDRRVVVRGLNEARLLASLAVELLEKADRCLDDAAGRALTHPDREIRHQYMEAIGASWKAVEAASVAHDRLSMAREAVREIYAGDSEHAVENWADDPRNRVYVLVPPRKTLASPTDPGDGADSAESPTIREGLHTR